jgi:acyl phosphate:glycerol-3-phosphate acyltransferase
MFDSSLITRYSLLFFSFLSGSIPFSVWIGKFALHKDIRSYGDGNPGGTNVLRAGGIGWGVLAILLDIFKAAFPVGLAYYIFGIDGLWMLAIAIAPILGHAFSPFLKFHGGKAVAAAYGMWIGLTVWEASTISGLMLLFWFKVIDSSGWSIMFTCLSLLGYLLLAHNTPLLIAIWTCSTAILAWTHRADLKKPPHIRDDAWVRKLWKR